MTQQINLYQAQAKKRVDKISFRQMMQIWAGFAVILLLISVIDTIQFFNSRAELRKLQKTKEEMDKQLSKTKRNLVITGSKEELEKQIAKLQRKINLENAMIEKLKMVEVGGQEGFSRYFIALAERTLPGIWLTKFSFKDRGNIITLQGAALTPVLVPKLIENLSQETVFQGKTFQVFKLSTNEKTNQIDFALEGAIKKSE